MDILRKEIYSIYEAQHLDEEANDPGCVDEAKNRAKILADSKKISELYTGQTAIVSHGEVAFPKYENSIAILRAVE